MVPVDVFDLWIYDIALGQSFVENKSFSTSGGPRDYALVTYQLCVMLCSHRKKEWFVIFYSFVSELPASVGIMSYCLADWHPAK